MSLTTQHRTLPTSAVTAGNSGLTTRSRSEIEREHKAGRHVEFDGDCAACIRRSNRAARHLLRDRRHWLNHPATAVANMHAAAERDRYYDQLDREAEIEGPWF